MIVVDTNVIVYLLSAGPSREAARVCLGRDPAWRAPPLWRSEYLNALATGLRRGDIDMALATDRLAAALDLMAGGEITSDPRRVLDLITNSRLSAYDCEFVAVARQLGVRLVTADRAIARAFPETAIPLAEFAE